MALEVVKDLTSQGIPEESTAKITFTVKDEDGNVIAGSNLDTLTVTLHTEAYPFTVINSRTDTNILGANGGQVDGSGNGSWVMDPQDNQIINDKGREVHICQFKWTYNSGAKTGYQLVRLLVVNLEKVT